MSNLFGEDDGKLQSSLWVGMPEFVQEKVRPFKELKIRFETKEDYENFSKLINQSLTEKTKSIWYPELTRGKNASRRYIDDESK